MDIPESQIEPEEAVIEDVKVSSTGKIIDAVQCYYVEECEYNEASADEIAELVQQFSHMPLGFYSDEPRHGSAHSSGGKVCQDKRIISSMRGVGKYVIAQIGKKLLSGDMNLTRISFPIRGMIAKSGLEKNLASTIFFPLYVNKACSITSTIERFKLVMTACISTFFINLSFHKPLNPILGETIQGHLNDGTQLYAEQMSHHPPISAFYAVGPNEEYYYYGNYNYEAQSRLNSITLRNRGKRTVRFKNGQTIEYNFAYESYSGAIMGTTKVETLGHLNFIDRDNQIEANIRFGKVKKKPSDYFQGLIMVNGEEVGNVYGSYMGFLEFNGIRYWDFRRVQPFKVTIDPPTLLSDPQFRNDYQQLKQLDIDGAQQEKEILEEIQRRDAKLRQKYNDHLKKILKMKEEQF